VFSKLSVLSIFII